MRIAIVLAGAAEARAELARVQSLIDHPRRISLFLVNDQIALYPRYAEHAVTLHPAKLTAWLNQRAFCRFPSVPRRWSFRLAPPVPISDLVADRGGSSGMLAVDAARAEGIERIVLCGVPMLPEAGHFFRQRPWHGATFFQDAWKKRRPDLAACVRSCSGLTAELFGQPDRAFLNG